MVIQADLNFKQQFDSICLSVWVFKIKNLLSQRYSNTSKLMRFGKVYLTPLPVSFWPCGCNYDNENHEFQLSRD